jgi:hypothetical protein
LPRWHQIINDGGLFLDRWAHQAAAFGWTALDVFGEHGQRSLSVLASEAMLRLRRGA